MYKNLEDNYYELILQNPFTLITNLGFRRIDTPAVRAAFDGRLFLRYSIISVHDYSPQAS
jgi:hypothetical protein